LADGWNKKSDFKSDVRPPSDDKEGIGSETRGRKKNPRSKMSSLEREAPVERMGKGGAGRIEDSDRLPGAWAGKPTLFPYRGAAVQSLRASRQKKKSKDGTGVPERSAGW